MKIKNAVIVGLFVCFSYLSHTSSPSLAMDDLNSTESLEKKKYISINPFKEDEKKESVQVSSLTQQIQEDAIKSLPITTSLDEEGSIVKNKKKKKKKKKKQSKEVSFESLNQKEYEDYINNVIKFYNLESLSKAQKVENLLLWSKSAGVPIVGLSQNENFFQRNLHITDPQADSELLRTLNDYEIRGACYTPEDVYLNVREKGSMQEFQRRKKITNLIKANVLLYHSDEDMSFSVDNEDQNKIVEQKNLKKYEERSTKERISPQICIDFIAPYIKDLIEFPESYIDQVIKGISYLPKRIVNVMRGKAIYLTQEYGPSMTIHTASNIRKIEYLGLIPGIFLERLKGGDQLLHTQLVHEVGHLVHQTVILDRFFDPVLKLYTMPLAFTFPEFHGYAQALEQLFKGDSDHYKENEQRDTFQQVLPDRLGFITYYSLKNREEDFAEVFKYFILHNKYINETASNRKLKNLSKKHKDTTLFKKYELMKEIVGQEGVQIGKDVLKVEEYQCLEINTK